MIRIFTDLKDIPFPARWYAILLALLLLTYTKIQAQDLPSINAANGLVPGCTTEEQELNLTITGSNFSTQAGAAVLVRVRGTAFTGEYLIAPASPNTATQIEITIPANDAIVAAPGTLTIDIQQADPQGSKVFSNAVQLPVYPKTGPVSGAAVVCGNTQHNYTVPRLAGAARYEWSVVSGNATLVSGGTTNTARINFSNAAGMVRLAVTTFNSCGTTGSTSTLDIQVNTAPTVSLPAFSDVCANAPAFALSGGSPAGGTYTVNGVVATTFNPAAAGVGSYSISYYFTQNGCTASATQTLTVIAAPQVSFGALSPICVNAVPITLTGGSPTGGSYSGPGVSGATFNPAVAGVGTHTITYTVSQEGCQNSATQTIEVLPEPVVSLQAFGNVCANAPAFALSGGSPAGGTYTVNGVVATTFNPAAAGVGTYSISYSFTQNGCTASATQTLTVIAAPQVSFTALRPICFNAAPITLTGGSPTGGSYSGPGVSGATFNPAVAGVGTHTITYTVTQNGCQNSVTQNITVLNIPAAGISVPASGTRACQGATVTLTATPAVAGSSYQWLLNDAPIANATSATYDASASGSYKVQVTDANCTAVSDFVIVTIMDPTNILTDEAPVSYCIGEATTLHALTGTGYGYQWYKNDTLIANATAATLTVSQAGTYKVTLTPAGCSAITSEAIAVTETPQITNNTVSTTADEVICTGSTVLISGSAPAAGNGTYTYQWQRRTNNSGFLNIAGATGQHYTFDSDTFFGVATFRRVVTSGSCFTTSNEVRVTVNQDIDNNVLTAPDIATICAGSVPATITGSTATGPPDIVYSWESRLNGTAYTPIPNTNTADYTPGALTRTTIFRRVARSGPCTSISNTITITVTPGIGGNTIAAPASLICSNTDAGTLSGDAPTGGDGTYSYRWESSPDGDAFTPVPSATGAEYTPGALTQSTTFRRVVTSGTCTSISNALTITVSEEISGNSLAIAATVICSNTAPGTISGGPLAGGSGTYSYRWESSPDGDAFTPVPSATGAEYTPGALTQTTTFRRVVTSGPCTDTSNALTITVAPIATYTVLVTVPAGFPVCGETVFNARVIRNASVVNYPADPRIQQVTWEGGEDVTEQFLFDWWKNDDQSLAAGSTNGSITLSGLQPGEYYTVRARPLASDLPCALYNNRPDLVPANAGADLLFSNKIFSGHPEGYGVSIAADVQGAICPGTPVTFTAFPNDPNYTNPSYQWMLNEQDIAGANQPAFSSSEMKDGDIVSVRFNSDENQCSPVLAVNPVTMQLTAQTENRVANIFGPGNPEIGQPATYQVIPVDHSLGWRYQWTLTYADGREETLPVTSSNFLGIASIQANLIQISVTQIAPAGNCVDQDTASFSIFTEPLPVDLLYLKAREKAGTVVVEWATAMEQHNAGFEVQVSSDGLAYRVLGFVPSKNPDYHSRQVYTYIDQENGLFGTRYYRLKQMDLFGASAYFGPVAVSIQDPGEHLIAYPNPFTREICLEIASPEAGLMSVMLLNGIGSKVMERTLQIGQGLQKEVLAFTFHLPPGVYTLVTLMNGRTSRIKLVKQ